MRKTARKASGSHYARQYSDAAYGTRAVNALDEGQVFEFGAANLPGRELSGFNGSVGRVVVSWLLSRAAAPF